MTLLYLVAAWVTGIFLADAANSSGTELWLVVGAGSFLLALFVRRERTKRLVLICLALFAGGAARTSWAERPLDNNHIGHYRGWSTITGIISRDADVREQHTNLTIEAEQVEQNGRRVDVKGTILAQVPRYGDYQYGDRVTITGSLLTPPEFDDFSYRDYLARRGVHVMIPNAEIEIVEHDQGQPWYTALYDLKARAHRTITRLLPSPQAPLLSGILLGIDTEIPADVREAFNRTGTSHIIAISGSNIIIVMGVLMRLFIPLAGKKRASIITLTGVLLYTLFVGADAAVVRAAIMGGLALLAAHLGRRAYGLTTLAFAVWVMSLINPLVLWDIGFQLSAAATIGLVVFSDQFTAYLERFLKRLFAQDTTRQIVKFLSEPLAVSIAAQITTTPLILLYFGRLSVIGLLANILIVPIQSYVMVWGWLAVLVGLVWEPLGELAAWVAWLPLTYTLEVVRKMGRWDWASISFTLSSTYAWIFYGGLLIVALLRFQHPDDRAALFRRLQQRAVVVGLLAGGAMVAVLVWVAALNQPDGRLHVWFLDVGHGHAVLIQTPQGSQILVDGGPNPSQLRQAVGDALPFWDNALDVVIMTQAEDAAIGGLPALLERYSVKLALTNGQRSDILEAAWKNQKTRVLPVTAGYQLQTQDGVRIEVLSPQTMPNSEDDSKLVSMVLRLSYGDTSFLITPNMDAEAEEALIQAGWYVGSTVLELPAYGRDEENSADFLDKVGPQVAVVSVGAGNRANLPDSVVAERLQAPLYRTDQQGTIEIVTDGKKLWVYTHD